MSIRIAPYSPQKHRDEVLAKLRKEKEEMNDECPICHNRYTFVKCKIRTSRNGTMCLTCSMKMKGEVSTVVGF